MNAVGLRKKFMDEMAEDLLDQYMGVVKGTVKFTSNNSTARVEMWDLLKQAIASTKDSQKQDFENTNDIISAVREGKMSPQEGKEYMQLLNMQKVIDTEGVNTDDLGQLGFSFSVEEPEKILPQKVRKPDPDDFEW